MAMEDGDNNAPVTVTHTKTGGKKGDAVGDTGACIDRQPDTGVHQAGLSQTAGRGSRGGPGAPAATGIRVLKRNIKRNGSRGCVTRKTRFGSRERDWLKGDTQRGCVCLYGGTVDPQPPASGPQTSSTPQTDLQLVLCSTSTTVEELCAQRDGLGLYVQLHGDLVRRLDPTERPLQMVYDYLAAMGYTDPVRVQQEAANSDLSCLIRFYSGEYGSREAIIPNPYRLLLRSGKRQEPGASR